MTWDLSDELFLCQPPSSRMVMAMQLQAMEITTNCDCQTHPDGSISYDKDAAVALFGEGVLIQLTDCELLPTPEMDQLGTWRTASEHDCPIALLFEDEQLLVTTDLNRAWTSGMIAIRFDCSGAARGYITQMARLGQWLAAENCEPFQVDDPSLEISLIDSF